jgi:hypothetical protein
MTQSMIDSEKVIHVGNTPGLFFEFSSSRFVALQDEGYGPHLVTRENAQKIWEQMDNTGPVDIHK